MKHQAGEPQALSVSDLAVRYGGVSAVRSVSFTVEPGQSVGLIGANGAGKSTLMKAFSGLLRPVSGSICFDGNDIAAQPAFRIAAAGLVLVPEGRQLFTDMTIYENLEMGASNQHARPKFTRKKSSTPAPASLKAIHRSARSIPT